jgi:hypothetical protein
MMRGELMRITLMFGLFCAGCFNPNYHNPACGPNRECPSGLTCGPTALCVSEVPSDDVPDAPVVPEPESEPDASPAPAFKGFDADEGGEIRIEYIHLSPSLTGGAASDGLRALAYLYANPGSTKAFPLPNLNGCTDMTRKANWPMAVNPLSERVYLDPGNVVIDGGPNAFSITKQPAQDSDFFGRTHPADKWYFRFVTTTAFLYLTPMGKNSFDIIFTGSDELPPQVLHNVLWMPAAFDLLTPGMEDIVLRANMPATFTWTNPPQDGLPPGYVVLSMVELAGPFPSDGIAVLCVEPNDGSITIPPDMVNIARAKFPAGGVLARATFTHIPRELVGKDGPTGRRLDIVSTWCHASLWGTTDPAATRPTGDPPQIRARSGSR